MVTLRMIIKYLLLLPFNLIWYLQLLIPRHNKLWVFGAWFGDKYSDNTKALYEYVHNTETDISVIWLTRKREIKDHLNNEGKRCELIHSAKGILLSLKAGYVIYSSGIQDVNPYFINGAKIVNTWHGAPMKKIGLDDKYSNRKIKRILLSLFFPFLTDNLAGVVSTAELFNEKLSSAFNVPIERILCSGYPRNDIFYSSDLHPLVSEWNNKYNNPLKALYLPTFRSLSEDFRPFTQYGFNEASWNRFLDNNNIILISKGHFINKEFSIESKSSRIIHLSDNCVDDVNWLMKDVDILITDYSGAYFDFLLTMKPIILTPFDYEDYILRSRELYFDYKEIICGPITENWTEVKDSIEEFLLNDHYKVVREEKCLIFNKYQDANSSERLFNMITSNL